MPRLEASRAQSSLFRVGIIIFEQQNNLNKLCQVSQVSLAIQSSCKFVWLPLEVVSSSSFLGLVVTTSP